MKFACLLAAGLALLPGIGLAEGLQWGAGPGLFLSGDSEGFTTRRVHLYALPAFANGNDLTGAKLSHHEYSQHGWQESGEQASFIHRQGHPGDASSLQLETGIFRQGGHQMLSLDGNYARQLGSGTRIEVFANRDWVETATALNRGVHFTFAGAALEQKLGDHVTLVGLGAGQFFSDDNTRTHGRLRAIYQPWLESGLTFQLRHRLYHSSKEDVDKAYFNPENYRQTLLGVGYRQRLQGWVGALNLAAGPQSINGDDNRSSELLEFSLESPRSWRHSLKLQGGYSRAAGFGGPDYRYRYVQAEWLLPF